MNRFAMIALAGTATVAMGQEINFSMTADETSLDVGQSTTVRIVIDSFSFTGFESTAVINGFELAPTTTGTGAGDISNAAAGEGGFAFGGALQSEPTDQFNLLDVSRFNAQNVTGTGLDVSGNSVLPFEIFTYTFTATAAGTATLDLDAVSLFLFTVSPSVDLDNAQLVAGTANVTGDTITIVPTPASAALLGLGGLAAARRRR